MLIVMIRDLVGLFGAASIAYGAWMAYPPAGFIVAGAFAMTGAYLHGRLSSEPTEESDEE